MQATAKATTLVQSNFKNTHHQQLQVKSNCVADEAYQKRAAAGLHMLSSF
jgi:hypothetical protein